MNEETEELVEIFLDYLNATEASCMHVRQRITKLVKAESPSIGEQNFLNLEYQATKGNKLQDFEICFKSNNPVDAWQRAFNILKVNNATIKNHYAPEGMHALLLDLS